MAGHQLETNLQIFGRALSERQEATISVATDPERPPFSIHFEEPADASRRDGFWVVPVNPDPEYFALLIEQRTTVTVSFNVGSAILSFPSVLLQSKRTLLRGWRIRMRLPLAVKLVERRRRKRHPIPEGS